MLWALLPLAAGPTGAAAMLWGKNALSEAPKCAGKSWGVRVVLGGGSWWAYARDVEVGALPSVPGCCGFSAWRVGGDFLELFGRAAGDCGCAVGEVPLSH